MTKITISDALELGSQARSLGKINRAQVFFKAILKKFPKHPVANYNMGEILLEMDCFEGSLKFFEIALEANSINEGFLQSYIDALIALQRFDDANELLRKIHKKGFAGKPLAALFEKAYHASIGLTSNSYVETRERLLRLFEDRKLTEMLALCEASIEQYPVAYELWNFLGVANQRRGRFEDALAAFRKVTHLNPGFSDGFNNIGIVLRHLGRIDEAIQAYQTALTIKPSKSDSYFNLGLALQNKGDLSQAVEAYNKALSIMPDYPEAHNNLGNILYDQESFRDAEISYLKALELKPDYRDALLNLGKTYKCLGALSAGFKTFSKLIEIYPKDFEGHVSLAIVLRLQMKFSEALEACKQAVLIQAKSPEPYLVMGNIFLAQGLIDKAKTFFQKAYAICPENAQALYNLGIILSKEGNFLDAISLFKKSLVLMPDFAAASAQLLYLKRNICDWENNEQSEFNIDMLGTSNANVAPFTLLSSEDNPENHLLRSQNFAKSKFNYEPIYLPKKPSKRPPKITLGYFSADFKHHPVSILMAGVFEKHDRSRFRVFGYSIGKSRRDAVRLRLENAFDDFKDVSEFSDEEVVDIARKDKVDIAIDLTGYTGNCRVGIFALRAAPIQINYLGYPGSMGASFMDYIIADKFLIPKAASRYYQEKIIYMPHSYQAQDDTLVVNSRRKARPVLGAAQNSFVFCAINNCYKINESAFDIWMRLLKKIDKSVLWLLESNHYAKFNLIKEAERRGVDSSRLIFASTVSHQNYLEQFTGADLYLDTFDYNAGATASAALSSGLPLITKSGQGYAARMGGSLLKALKLSDLITQTEEQYENLALDLARNPKRLKDIKMRLRKSIKEEPLFQTRRFTINLEKSYEEALSSYIESKNIKNIEIAD